MSLLGVHTLPKFQTLAKLIVWYYWHFWYFWYFWHYWHLPHFLIS
ncbi:hypothetical protein HMPREF1320_2133 [Capnocytophaga sp. oral taxon 335 str. F0486]|nr:hypothetical protein HMPREF1320_2133 [Capnocytophaga sp. oral taxon 335 str. F0486]